MAKNNVNNETVNNAPVQEQQNSAPETVQQPVAQPAPQQQEAQLPAANPQPAEAEEAKPKFWETKLGKGIKKVGAVLGGIAALTTVAVVAEKIGESNGFDKASDAFNNLTSDGQEPSSDGNDLGEASITEVSEET